MSYQKLGGSTPTTFTQTYTQATGTLASNVNGVAVNTDLSCLKSAFNGLTVTNPITTCFKGYSATKMVRELRVAANGVDGIYPNDSPYWDYFKVPTLFEVVNETAEEVTGNEFADLRDLIKK